MPSTANIFNSRSECSLYQALNTGEGVSGFHPQPAALIGISQGNSGYAIPPQERGIADSVIFDRHGDDRFADNILRACENLPQHGDDEEELDAAEEGAAIEASGYPDPAYERNGR